MSVIAWDGKTVAADRQANQDNTRSLIKKLSVVRRTGDILGTVGGVDYGLKLEKWYRAGARHALFPKPKLKDDDATLIVFTRSGRVFEFTNSPDSVPITDKFQAWGDGSDLAIGAMAMGATAREAVKITCRYKITCGMGVTSYRIAPK